MNKFKNLFRHKSSRKEEDEFDKFVRDKENERPKSKKVDPFDRTATACYHTEVAPKTKRGPKSCPGGVSDDLGGGHVNRSFETEIPHRRRPSEFRESTRHKRGNMAFSEYGAPSTKMSNITYHREVVEERIDEEEVDVDDLKAQVKELQRKLYFANARKHYYKSEFNDHKDEQRRINKAYKAQEEKYQRELQEKDDQIAGKDAAIKVLRENLARCQCHRNTMIYQNTLNQHTLNHHMMFNNSFAPAPSNTTPVVSDPQPTRTDLFPMSANFSHFDSGEKDEMKVFRHRDSTSTFTEDMDY